MAAKVAIVILNWNGENFLRKFLKNVVTNSNFPGAEVIVADNGSTDGSRELLGQFPTVRTIAFEKNFGYTGGYNRALKQVDADYYILLNSDIEVPEGWLAPLIEFMEAHPDVAACAPKLLDYNQKEFFEYAGAAGGFIDMFGYPFCRGRILSEIEADSGQYDTPMPIFWASGACMMVRSNLFWQVGGLDEDFFAHMEEIDLCWRLQLNGYSIYSVPQSRVYHVGGGTLPNNNPFKLYLNYRNNLFMLHKNLSTRAIWVILPVRLILDILSSLVYLINGKLPFAKAVFSAHRDYLKRLKSLNSKRTLLPRKANPNRYRGLILVDFFIFRRRQFNKLKYS